MVLDTTYNNKEHDNLINDIVGRPYSFIQSIKMGGTGSKRMMIEEVSPNFKSYMNTVSDINYGNIEMRPNGILLYINKGLRNFTWVIPFYQLVIYKTNGASIHAQGRFVRFRNNKLFKENKSFFSKLLDAKVNYDLQYEMPHI
jgi:hypothetical protein